MSLLLSLAVGCNEGGYVIPGNLDPEGWAWGDLHAHSAWSYDGCEEPGLGCGPRPGGAGSDFFDNAAAVGLDFAAITDHAEADFFLPDGAGGEELEVWPGQAALVVEAEGGQTIPLLGYEWTAFRGDSLDGRPRGGHRTVVLGDPSACPDYRVSGYELPQGMRDQEHGSALYLQDPDGLLAKTGPELWDALDAAGETCEPVRWLSFVHHPAYTLPQQTDWLLPENEPTREQLVEVYSEHGSSECWDTTREGCDFRINEGQGYYPDGSVQRALDEGFRLGFTAGTDSHDARPGSIEDGPGTVGSWKDLDGDGVGDEVMEHFTAGGITGVYLPDSRDVDGLFDALEARSTIASSGPRPWLAAWVLGKGGGSFLPGEAVPADVFPADVRLQVEEPEDGWLEVELVGATGEVLATGEGGSFSHRWDAEEGDYAYLRVRYFEEGADDAEVEVDRLWISPFWVDPAEECGCSASGRSAGATGVSGALWVVLLAAIRRRRWRGPQTSGIL